MLAKKISSLKVLSETPIVLAIARGGVPVAAKIAGEFKCPLNVLVLRKLPIPDNTEAGFGAVTLDRTVILNEPLLSELCLKEPRIQKIIDEVYDEVLRRSKTYYAVKPLPYLKSRTVAIIDDGLASGYTMLSAVEFCRRKEAAKIIVAVPVAHENAYELVRKRCDKIVTLHISKAPFFAVASFYKEFPEMADEEVLYYLRDKPV